MKYRTDFKLVYNDEAVAQNDYDTIVALPEVSNAWTEAKIIRLADDLDTNTCMPNGNKAITGCLSWDSQSDRDNFVNYLTANIVENTISGSRITTHLCGNDENKECVDLEIIFSN